MAFSEPIFLHLQVFRVVLNADGGETNRLCTCSESSFIFTSTWINRPPTKLPSDSITTKPSEEIHDKENLGTSDAR